jgi:hypothetical protein
MVALAAVLGDSGWGSESDSVEETCIRDGAEHPDPNRRLERYKGTMVTTRPESDRRMSGRLRISCGSESYGCKLIPQRLPESGDLSHDYVAEIGGQAPILVCGGLEASLTLAGASSALRGQRCMPLTLSRVSRLENPGL